MARVGRVAISSHWRLSLCRASAFLIVIVGLALSGAFVRAFGQDATAADAPPDRKWSAVYLLEGGGTSSTTPTNQASESTPTVEALPPVAGVVSFPGRFESPSEGRAPQDNPDVAVRPSSTVTQSEISTFVDPSDPNIVFVSSNSTDWPVSQVYGTGVYWSLDGGLTWDGNDFGPGGVGNKGDPAAVVRGLDGRWVVGYISTGFGQGVSYTDDRGATWSHVNIFPSGTLDKNHLMVDNVPTSPYYGNLYAAWSALGGGVNANDIEFVRSVDGGATWPGSATNISNGVNSGSHDQGVNIQVGPNGEVYAIWAIYDCWPCDETAIGFNKSTDGGATWTGEYRAITNIRGHRNTSLPNTSIRRNSFPSMAVDVSGGPNDGAIYVVWTNQGVPGVNVGDTDIYLAKSTDGGLTFGTPIRVNQDATTNSQWFPWISCDPSSGALAVVFLDRREDPANRDARAYMAVSADGGTSWEDFAVADVSFTPTPIPGLAGGYMGDYLGMAVANGHAYPTWTDNRSGNFLCYVSPTLILDGSDPNPPTDVTAFSDYTTPSSVQLDWIDPTTMADGSPLPDFSIDIWRDGGFVANVDQGNQVYTDSGLTDGQEYVYLLQARDDTTDSLSVGVEVAVFAGGSPVPAPPTAAGCSSDSVSATITWTNPSTQVDGTTLDDFAGVRVYRDGSLLTELVRSPGDIGAIDQYVDMPLPGFVYSYEVSAIDSENPVNESLPLAIPDCFVGNLPNVLVWQPADVSSSSGDSIFAGLSALGESVLLTDNLSLFGPDLNVHEIVFACVGFGAGKHLIDATEGAALDDFVQDGGRLYLEGGDCFNNDPEAGGYNVRPIFGLADGPNGTADLFGVLGINDMAGFAFSYTGTNVSIDELQPVTSTALFQNDVNGDRIT
ncbi:MAG: exo-alpha-sialidase, partial [Acidimicrobiia bacterium]|nr:exo-alpha-sialidase [Acidimicrobiia bacterium]